MKWLRTQGLVSRYEDYLALPMPVLSHARLLMAAEGAEAKRQERAAEAASKRSERAGVRR